MNKVITTSLIGGLLTSACSSSPTIKHDSVVSVHKQVKPLLYTQWQAPHQAGFLQQRLTNLFKIPALNQLIQTALKNNTNLQQTALRLKEQGLLVKQTKTNRLPSLDFSTQASRSGSGSIASTQYTLGLSANWEIDVWGKLAHQEQASRYQYQATQADLIVAKRSLVAQVVRHWISLAAQQQIIRIEQQHLNKLKRLENSALNHFQAGNNVLSQVLAAKTNHSSRHANLLQRQETFKATQRALNILLGQAPTTPLKLPQQLPQIVKPLAQVPSEVIGARPDLQAAYARLQAANQQTQVAYKQLLPSISLTPTANQGASQMERLLSGDIAWQLLGQLAGSLFDGGKKRINVATQKSVAQRAALTYRQTLLNALLEVENALSQEASYTQQLQILNQSYTQARQSQTLYEAQYQQGSANLSELIAAQTNTFNQQMTRLELQRSQLENRVQLALALGMGV